MMIITTIRITIAIEYQINGPPIMPVVFRAIKILTNRIDIKRI